MKYILKTSKPIKENFLNELLLDRGILKDDEDYNRKYFNPTRDCLLEPTLLDNMEKGFGMFKRHLENGSKIVFIVDSDVDGITSSSAFINYINDNLKEKYPNIEITYILPEGKEHGLETKMDYFTNKEMCDLIVCPDSSSNDYEEHRMLRNLGYDILVLDHHEAEKYSEDAVVINNQLSENYENKDLSGAGVVYKFLQYCDKEFGINKADDYLDLISTGICGDMMQLNNLENRYITKKGFSEIRNEGLKALITAQEYSLFGTSFGFVNFNSIELTPTQIAFYIVPLMNALIRVGDLNKKEILFKALLDGGELIESTKRGEKGKMETVGEQNARNCINAKAKQNREKEKTLELLDIQIGNDCLDENKILFLRADDLDVSNTLTGLCAMGVVASYKKPTLLGRLNKEGYIKGSIRGVNGSELKDFKGFLLDSGLMDYVEGHANSAGFSIKASNVDKLLEYANRELVDVNFNEGCYEVDFIVKEDCPYLEKMIYSLDNGKNLWGQGNNEALVVVENITIKSGGYSIIGKNQDTLRFTKNGITYIKFKATDFINELAEKDGNIILNICGRAVINEWNGIRKPQILITEAEIISNSKYEF